MIIHALGPSIVKKVYILQRWKSMSTMGVMFGASKVALCWEVICLFGVSIQEEWFHCVSFFSCGFALLPEGPIVTSSVCPLSPISFPLKGEGQPSPSCHGRACPVHPWLLLLPLLRLDSLPAEEERSTAKQPWLLQAASVWKGEWVSTANNCVLLTDAATAITVPLLSMIKVLLLYLSLVWLAFHRAKYTCDYRTGGRT